MSVTAQQWLVGGAVAVLTVGAVGLTVLALQHVQAAPADREVAPVPTFSQPAPVPSAQPTPRATPDVQVPSYDRSQERFLAVADGVLWRGIAGACGSADPLLERSADGGASWANVTPVYLGIGQLSALHAFAGSQAEVVASIGETCEVQALRTFTQGQFWESYDDVLMNSQYVDPANPHNILGLADTSTSPCADTRALNVSGSTVAISCDGLAYTLAADFSWTLLPLENVAALAVTDDEVTVAHVAEGCAGLALARFAGTGVATDLGCLADVDAAAPTAITVSDDDVLMWSGDSWIVTSP
ncbi:hypothetical protein [Streptomyces parvus]|uniref:hypothetical protein n=1 Tax=Streptomyces parvus TaxID=66428 RepID=UPI003715F152